MTDKQTEALKLALEALESGKNHGVAIDVLRRALAEQPAQQEPVAQDWSVFNTGAEVWSGLSLADAVAELTPERMERGWSAVCVINKDNPPLYTSPPASKPWVGLTEDERNAIGRHHAYVDNIIRATEAKLREKNA